MSCYFIVCRARIGVYSIPAREIAPVVGSTHSGHPVVCDFKTGARKMRTSTTANVPIPSTHQMPIRSPNGKPLPVRGRPPVLRKIVATSWLETPQRWQSGLACDAFIGASATAAKAYDLASLWQFDGIQHWEHHSVASGHWQSGHSRCNYTEYWIQGLQGTLHVYGNSFASDILATRSPRHRGAIATTRWCVLFPILSILLRKIPWQVWCWKLF